MLTATRNKKLTSARRREIALQAIHARWYPKPEPKRWYGVFEWRANGVPQPLFWSKSKEECLTRCKELASQEQLGPHECSSFSVDWIDHYNPSRFQLTASFTPDTGRMAEALATLAEDTGGQS